MASFLTRVRNRISPPKPTDWSDRPPEEAWQASIDGEVEFWRKYIANRGGRWKNYEDRIDPNRPLQPEIAALIHAPAGATVRVLDTGAGPLTFLGCTSDTWDLEVTALDVLADEYGKLLDEAGIVPPVRTQRCESERLTSTVPSDHFDLVAARNTLDHCYDPLQAISEMLTVAKPGAALLLVHHRNTAEKESYHGMHQWNFEGDGDTFVVWRPGTRTDVTAALADRCSFESRWVDGTWEHVVLRRHPAET